MRRVPTRALLALAPGLLLGALPLSSRAYSPSVQAASFMPADTSSTKARARESATASTGAREPSA